MEPIDKEVIYAIIKESIDNFYLKQEVDDKIESLKRTVLFFDEANDSEFMEVAFIKNEDNELFFSNDVEEWDVDTLSPIGIVVIPESHNVYGTGQCGVLALCNNCLTSPDIGDLNENGITNIAMWWGGTNHGLTNYNSYPILGNCNGAVQSNITGTLTSNLFLPSDRYNDGPICPTDNTTHYYNSNDAARGWGPSPYNKLQRNPLYYTTNSPVGSGNPLSRFDGDENTKKLLEKATGQSNWKTASTITNSGSDNYFPSACCCWRYHTKGTEQGDWYLPAEGELGYLVPRYQKICNTINKLNEVFGKVGTPLLFEGIQNYYSSTPSNSASINRISTMNGTVGTSNGGSGNGTATSRAFIKLPKI